MGDKRDGKAVALKALVMSHKIVLLRVMEMWLKYDAKICVYSEREREEERGTQTQAHATTIIGEEPKKKNPVIKIA